MRSLTLLAAAALSLGAALSQDGGSKTYGSFLGGAPPELELPRDGWLNAEQPLSLSGLRGKVVWLEFSFST